MLNIFCSNLGLLSLTHFLVQCVNFMSPTNFFYPITYLHSLTSFSFPDLLLHSETYLHICQIYLFLFISYDIFPFFWLIFNSLTDFYISTLCWWVTFLLFLQLFQADDSHMTSEVGPTCHSKEVFYFDLNFTEICSQWLNQQLSKHWFR